MCTEAYDPEDRPGDPQQRRGRYPAPQRAMQVPNRIVYLVSAVSTSAMLFIGGYFYGLNSCKSFADKLKDFLF